MFLVNNLLSQIFEKYFISFATFELKHHICINLEYGFYLNIVLLKLLSLLNNITIMIILVNPG